MKTLVTNDLQFAAAFLSIRITDITSLSDNTDYKQQYGSIKYSLTKYIKLKTP